jgi:hypothetical protein
MKWPFPTHTTPPLWYCAFWVGMFLAYCAFWTWMGRR